MKFMKLLFLFIFFSNILCQSTLTKLKEKLIQEIKEKKNTLTGDISQLIRKIDYQIPIMSGSVNEGEIDSKCKELSLSTSECARITLSKFSKNEVCQTSESFSFRDLLVKKEKFIVCSKNENGKLYYYLIKGLVFGNLNKQKQKITKKKCSKFLMFKKCKNYEEFVERGFTTSEIDIISNVLNIKLSEEIIKKLENKAE